MKKEEGWDGYLVNLSPTQVLWQDVKIRVEKDFGYHKYWNSMSSNIGVLDSYIISFPDVPEWS